MTTLVIISHSEQIANGTKALLQQMAPDVNVVANGGVNGDIGTSFETVQQLINDLEDDAMCFYDIGSSEMNIDMAIDMYDGPYKIVKVDAPIVEGSFTAAMSLSVGKTANEAIQEVNRSSFKSTAFK